MTTERTRHDSLTLPLTRIRTIMKSSPDVENISSDAVFLVAKATEFFLEQLVKDVHKISGKSKELGYNCLAEVVHTKSSMEFLQEMVPKKITISEYRELIEREKQENF